MIRGEEVHRFGALLFICYDFTDLQNCIDMVEYGYFFENCMEVSYGMV